MKRTVWTSLLFLLGCWAELCAPPSEVSKSWVVAAAAVVGAAAAAYGAWKQSQAAKDAADSADDAVEFEKDRWKMYTPLERELIKTARLPADQQPGLSRMLSEIEKGYGTQSATANRDTLSRTPWGGGLRDNTARDLSLRRSYDRGNAFYQADQDRMQRMMDVASLGRNLSPVGQLAGTQTANAQYQQSAAGQAWGSAGSAIGNLAQLWMQTQNANKTTQQQQPQPWQNTYQYSGTVA